MALVRDAAERAGTPDCAGVAVPGLIAFAEGRIELCSNLPYLTGVPLRDVLANALGLPVALDNDANLAAYGEYAARGASGSLVFVTISTGIGGGYVAADGSVLRGAKGRATDFGHIKVTMAGEACYCGQTGCWETISSGRFLAERASRDLGRPVSTPELFALAEAGDAPATALVTHAAEVAGLALAGLARAFDPDAVVLGGGVGLAGGLYQRTLRGAYRAALEHFGEVPLEPSRLGGDAGVLGAGWFGLRAAAGG
jgi:glucokinase